MTIAINNKQEMRFAQASLVLTSICFAGLFQFLLNHLAETYSAGDMRTMAETALFSMAMAFIAYGTLLYHVCLIGCYKRKQAHKPVEQAVLESIYRQESHPALSIIIPSYKEERTVIWQTMVSAALAEYPEKNVVVLIDDPYHAKALEDMLKLEDTRAIPGELQQLFDAEAVQYRGMLALFSGRLREGRLNYKAELLQLAGHYDAVAAWLDALATQFIDGKRWDCLSHADRFFIEAVIGAPAQAHRARAKDLRAKAVGGAYVTDDYIEGQYKRLVGLFTMRFSSFERKKYINLCHEANKAMNLNSYIELIGRSWREVETDQGWRLQECAAEHASFTIPHADYVDTIDADSLMLADYALRLVHLMEQPENRKLAVVQSPCSSFPNAPKGLERMAGACIDVQFLTHQGYTHWNATFWVGANAMLRHQALKEIREVRYENENEVAIYIQDHTVIEDTESTIDLVSKGWQLYNYPERMTFSATPPDFGSLLIQRRRWSNGGLLILPKLIHYALTAPKNATLLKEIFMRFNYLASTSIGCFVALLFFLYPFGDVISTPWLLFSTLPFMALYARDLRNSGYRYSDLFRICALNLMLFPIVTGGVLKSVQQILTGKKIPFGRTPKVTGRTAAPALYCLVEVLVAATFLATAGKDIAIGHWSQASFALINGGFMTYALVYFMGIKATAEDLFSGIIARWRKAVHQAEIIPISSVQHVASSLTGLSAPHDQQVSQVG